MIKEKFSTQATMIEGSGGVFDVHIDGRQIWSKQDTGRFPEHHEILNKIAELSGKK